MGLEDGVPPVGGALGASGVTEPGEPALGREGELSDRSALEDVDIQAAQQCDDGLGRLDQLAVEHLLEALSLALGEPSGRWRASAPRSAEPRRAVGGRG